MILEHTNYGLWGASGKAGIIMRSAAREPAEDDPAPARPDLEAKADQALSEHLVVLAEIRDVLRSTSDPQQTERLKDAILVLLGSGPHLEEVRGAIAGYMAFHAGADSFFEAGRAHERAVQEAAARAAVPGPRHRRSSRWANIPGQKALFVVKGFGIAALLPLGKRLAGHKAVTGAVMSAATAGLAVAVTLGPSSLLPFNGQPPGAQAAVPGWHTSASPIPSSSLIAQNVTHPKGKHSAKGKGLASSGLPVTCCWASAQPTPSPSSSSPSVQASVQAGTLSVNMTSVDLSATPQVTVEIDAAGAPADWKAWCNSSDVTLDGAAASTSGTATPDQPSYLTLGLASALDTLLGTTCHVWPGDLKIAVTIQVPVPVVPSVVPSAVASVLPTDLPSVIPSGA